MKQIQPGIYREGKFFYTENQAKGAQFHEQLRREGGKEYRQWDARSSKLCAALTKGMTIPIETTTNTLYLGSSHGYTVSYLSDITTEGTIFAVEFAPRVMRDMVFLAEQRTNLIPILADANKPEMYYHLLKPVNMLFQDIAQKNQVEIFLKNAALFLKKDGFALLSVKARSIDTTREPKKIFQEVKTELEKHAKILEQRNLEPFQKDHSIFLCKVK